MYICSRVEEELDKLSAPVEILSFGNFGARFGINWMTNVIAQRRVLCFQKHNFTVQYKVLISWWLFNTLHDMPMKVFD